MRAALGRRVWPSSRRPKRYDFCYARLLYELCGYDHFDQNVERLSDLNTGGIIALEALKRLLQCATGICEIGNHQNDLPFSQEEAGMNIDAPGLVSVNQTGGNLTVFVRPGENLLTTVRVLELALSGSNGRPPYYGGMGGGMHGAR